MSDLFTPSTWTMLDLSAGRRCQIEASAGTGKTWTISVLYLRLLLERGLSARQIVVATFTDAATQELLERIRRRLLWGEHAAEAFLHDSLAPVGDDDAHYLLRRWQHDAEVCRSDQLRLRLAQAELDLAPIGTLHGLCVRILREYPLAAGSGFELGELVSAQSLQQELLTDLKRQLAQSTDPMGPGDRRWLDDFSNLSAALKTVADPGIRIDAPELTSLAEFMSLQRAAELRQWAADADKFVRSNAAYRSALGRLAKYIENGDLDQEFKPEILLANRTLEGQIKPALIENLRREPVVDFAARAATALADYDAAVRADAIARYRAQLQRWREQRLIERGLFTYDALIERVHTALSGESSQLADALCAAWPVALIDEFQDTDAQQYAILDRIYRDSSGAARGCLVMIGDPKQAIYAFRGGDTHTYQRAARDCGQRLSLDVNRRSSRAYVSGLNAFYELATPGLGRRDMPTAIDYVPVHASARRDYQPYSIAGERVARPLQFYFRENPPVTKSERECEALQACAWQIADMLQSGKHVIGTTPLRPGDLAVLLPSNRQVAALRVMLAEVGVPCAGAGQQAVFATEWARELQVVLYAIAHCDEAGAVRAALSTILLGYDIAALRALGSDAGRWQLELQSLHALLQVWQRQGVLAVVQRMIERAAPRLRARGDYERTITDLRHLGELLQTQSEMLHGPTQLLAWLDAQRREPQVGTEDSNDHQLRIESDSGRVRLMTLHASKGMEFRMVFLPLMWAHQGRARTPYPLVVDADSGARVADFGTHLRVARLQQAAVEDQNERFRVLYVALTRAEYGCHVYALPPSRRKDGRTSTPLGDPDRSALDALIERLLESQQRDPQSLRSLPGVAWHEQWPTQRAHYRAPVPAHIVCIVQAEPEPRPVRSVHSFSTLVRHAQRALSPAGPGAENAAEVEETAAVDEALIDADALLDAQAIDAVVSSDATPVSAASEPHPELLALDALRGAQLGNALHAVFEHRVPGTPVQAQLPLLLRAFQTHDVRLRQAGGEYLVALWAARIDAALAADLGAGLRLVDLSPAAQCAEMEFHFAVDRLPLDTLRGICRLHGAATLIPEQLGQASLNGLVTGKIDLVLEHGGRFHLLDYKGNALGILLEDYLPDALEQAMDAHHYRFQALIYTLAVDRMLAMRIPTYQRAQHLGDAIYLFVRGAGLASGAGVWRHRFDDALIEDLQRALSIAERAQ